MKMADGHARAGFVITPAVARADLLQLPVHAGGAVVVNLDAIHADVALAGVRVAVTTQGSVMNRPPSSGQHFRMGRLRRVEG